MTNRKLRVAMDDLLDAMTAMRDDASRYYLDIEDGSVVAVLELLDGLDEDEIARAIEEDPDRYAEIPRIESQRDYDLMRRFADSVEEADIREKLDLALRGKGAFGRFRDVVFPYPDLKAKWLTVRQEALLAEAKGWLDSLGIEPVYELRPVERLPAKEPARALAEPKVGLLDLLVLGAPDGKTERIDGRVLRRLDARTPSQAGAAFKNLARELCGFHGLAWRNRHIEGKSAFDLERVQLRVEGTIVELSIEVPDSVWNAFV